jgi:hypothetical protein
VLALLPECAARVTQVSNNLRISLLKANTMTQTSDNLSALDTPLMRHHLEHLRHCAASDLASGTEAFFRFLEGEIAIRTRQATAREIEKLLPNERTSRSDNPRDEAQSGVYNVCVSDIHASLGLGATALDKDATAVNSAEDGEEVLAQRAAAVVAGPDQCGAPQRARDVFVDDAAIASKWAAQVSFGNVSTATYFIRQAIAEFSQALVRRAASRSVVPRNGMNRLSIADCIAQFRTYAAATPNADVQHALVFVADFLRDHGPLTASDEDIEDAGRYRWLASGWTAEELAEAEQKGRQPAHTRQQDVVNHLAAWYLAKDQFDEIIDKAKQEAAQP